MPLYACSKCDAVENTALANYWWRQGEAYQARVPFLPLCSECDPTIGKWHGQFPKERADNGLWEPDSRDPEHYLQRKPPPPAGPDE